MSATGELGIRLAAITEQAHQDPSSAWDLARADEAGASADPRTQVAADPSAQVAAESQARVAAVMIGVALAALDEYEAFVCGRITEPMPAPPGDQESDYRRWLGMAIGRLETARCILDEAALDAVDHTRVRMLAREAARLAYDTVQDLIVPVSGAGAGSDRLTEAAGVMLRLWAHPLGAGGDQFSRQVARERLQLA